MENKKFYKTRWYNIGAKVTGLIAFLLIWMYISFSWDMFYGLVFGWIPAFLGAIVIGMFWPISVLVVAVLLIIIPGISEFKF